MDEQEFRRRADETLEMLYKKLVAAADSHDFEPDFNNGALSVDFEEPKARFVISPNAPVRQVWVSAHSRSFKLDWDEARGTFTLPASGQSLTDFLSEAISTHLGEPVTL
ncbi:MAG TPA: iron donor protein CyaY [Bryobacteraceae bacterium]|jgi:CyaY protein